MTRFSANLGFLWTELPFTQAIHAAKTAGFNAVECHWPFELPVEQIKTALNETGLKMLGLNTSRGKTGTGESGLSALPGREKDARAAIDRAIAFALQIGAENIHIMAGNSSGETAQNTFISNLRYACEKCASNGLTLLIEPLNRHDAPQYFLKTTSQAVQIIETVGATNLKLMFDCYHVQISEGDLTRRLTSLLPVIGHIQFASVPDRGPPGHGEVNYAHIFNTIDKLGYTRPLGAEYRPGGPTDLTLGWMRRLT